MFAVIIIILRFVVKSEVCGFMINVCGLPNTVTVYQWLIIYTDYDYQQYRDYI